MLMLMLLIRFRPLVAGVGNPGLSVAPCLIGSLRFFPLLK